MNLISKGKNELIKVGKSIEITNKLIKEIDNKSLVPSDDFKVSIPDKNFQKYLIEELNLQFVDGTISYGDIKGIKKIRSIFGRIESLEGIQYFTALETLMCSPSHLTYIDVSNNTALTQLWCGGNQLTSLDVSKNTALIKLLCGGNQLTSLDVSKNSALETLHCLENQLTSLDVSNNGALEQLWCEENQLTSLDVSKNGNLKELVCYDNQLTSIDFGNNSNLKKVILDGNPGDWWKGLEKGEK